VVLTLQVSQPLTSGHSLSRKGSDWDRQVSQCSLRSLTISKGKWLGPSGLQLRLVVLSYCFTTCHYFILVIYMLLFNTCISPVNWCATTCLQLWLDLPPVMNACLWHDKTWYMLWLTLSTWLSHYGNVVPDPCYVLQLCLLWFLLWFPLWFLLWQVMILLTPVIW